MSSETPASAKAPILSAGESLEPFGSMCGLLSATRPGLILTPTLTLAPGCTSVCPKVASAALGDVLGLTRCGAARRSGEAVDVLSATRHLVVIFTSLINGLPNPGPSQKNSS